MRVRVLTFGVLRELAGGPEETVELLEGATVGVLIEILRGRTSNNTKDKETDEGIWRSLAVAVNREYASQAVVLHEGDEVALLPPVSGGSCAEGGNARTVKSSLRSRRLRCCAYGWALAMPGTARTAKSELCSQVQMRTDDVRERTLC
jgi:MoaD family protein